MGPYEIICCVLIIMLVALYIHTSIERKRLIELLAAKDYADYKNFEQAEQSKKDHSNMLTKREQVMKNRIKLEEE